MSWDNMQQIEQAKKQIESNSFKFNWKVWELNLIRNKENMIGNINQDLIYYMKNRLKSQAKRIV